MEYSLFFFIALFASAFANNVEYDGWLNIKLQHSYGTNTSLFTNRGHINIQSVRSGGFTISQDALSASDLAALQASANSDDFYQLKSTVQTSDGTESTFLSSVKAASILETGLHDCITVWFLHNGAVAAVGITPSGEGSPTGGFTTEVFVRHMDQAPVPDTANYIQKLEREREARDKGDVKDTRSFLAKYWMYIVPVAIFVLISGAANPDTAAAR